MKLGNPRDCGGRGHRGLRFLLGWTRGSASAPPTCLWQCEASPALPPLTPLFLSSHTTQQTSFSSVSPPSLFSSSSCCCSCCTFPSLSLATAPGTDCLPGRGHFSVDPITERERESVCVCVKVCVWGRERGESVSEWVRVRAPGRNRSVRDYLRRYPAALFSVMTLEAIRYRAGSLQILNQLLLPHQTSYDELRTVQDAYEAIKSMKVGSPFPLRLLLPAARPSPGPELHVHVSRRLILGSFVLPQLHACARCARRLRPLS